MESTAFELDVTLFERLPRGVTLSQVGLLFLDDMRNVLDLSRRARFNGFPEA